MKPTIISRKASNWVDRGESPIPRLCRVLAHFFEKFDAADEPWLREQAGIIVGMVAADATEVHVAGYIKSLVRDTGTPARERIEFRPVAISLWHIAKAALVRDFAERVLRGEIPPNIPNDEPLSAWLAQRILTPEELARFEAEAPED